MSSTETSTPTPPGATLTEPEKPVIVEGAHLFPAGIYAAADPMLVLPSGAWHHIVFTLMSSCSSVTVSYKGCLILVWTTKNGDGVYPLYEGKRFRANVATGNCLLCLAPAELLELPCTPAEAKEFPTMITGGIGIYEVEAATPRITADGNVAHGPFEVITSLEIGEEYDTQPYDFGGYVDDCFVRDPPAESVSK